MVGGLALLALSAVACWPVLMVSPDRYDSCMFRWMGQRMLAGDLPYRDMWDNKLPVLYWINAAAAATGHQRAALYALQVLAVGGGAILIASLVGAARARSHPIPSGETNGVKISGFLAAAVYVVMAASSINIETGNLTETWAAPLAILFAWSAARGLWADRPSVKWMFSAGVALGLAAALRPPAILLAALPLAMAWPWRAAHLKSAAALLGGLLVPAGVIVVWAAAAGVLNQMIDNCILFNFRYAAGQSRPDKFAASRLADIVLAAVFDNGVWWLIAAVGAASMLPLGRRRISLSVAKIRNLGLLWVAIALVSAVPSLRLYRHHFYLMLAPVALLTAGAWQALLASAGENRRARVLLALAAIGFVAIFASRSIRDDLAAARAGRASAAALDQAESFLRLNGRPDQTVFIFGWGGETDLFPRLGWPAATQHPMAFFYPELPAGRLMLTEWRDQFLADAPDWLICTGRNDIIADKSFVDSFGWKDNNALGLAADVADFCRRRYTRAAEFSAAGQTVIIYRNVAGNCRSWSSNPLSLSGLSPCNQNRRSPGNCR